MFAPAFPTSGAAFFSARLDALVAVPMGVQVFAGLGPI